MRGVAPVPIIVIRNGIRSRDLCGATVDRSSWPAAMWDFVASGTIFGTIARLSSEKNQLAMIDALAELVRRGLDVKMLFVGEGPERASLESRIDELQLNDRVLMPGFMK